MGLNDYKLASGRVFPDSDLYDLDYDEHMVDHGDVDIPNRENFFPSGRLCK